eukprot:UN26723
MFNVNADFGYDFDTRGSRLLCKRRTINWNEPHEDENCSEGIGAQENIPALDGGRSYADISSVENCMQICEDHDYCNCIVFSGTQCWLRRLCTIEQCRHQSGFTSVIGTRVSRSTYVSGPKASSDVGGCSNSWAGSDDPYGTLEEAKMRC